MTLPAPLAALTWIHARKSGRAHWFLNLAGQPGWCRIHAQGFCTAVEIGPSGSDAWLQRTCLWLASTRDGLDDGLLLNGDRLWLVRRHPQDITPSELDTALRQQAVTARCLPESAEPPGERTVIAALGRRV